MDLEESATEAAFRATARTWLSEHLPADWPVNSVAPAGLDVRLEHFGRAWERALHEAGLNGLSWPVEYGGRGEPVSHEMILLEEMARLNVPESINNVAKTMLAPTIMAHGSDDQKAFFLPRIISGEHVWCQGFSEPEAGSDLAGVRTRAERVDGQWRVTGQKLWTSRAQISDYCFALVRTDTAATRRNGLTMMLVLLAQDGVDIRPLKQANGEDEFNEVFFDGAIVNDDQVLGSVGDGWQVALTILTFERGVAHFGRHLRFRRQLDALAELARSLEVNGTAVSERDDFRQRFADRLAEVEIYRLMAYQEMTALSGSGTGNSGPVVKLFWTDMWRAQQQLALDLLGPFANTLEGPGAVDATEWEMLYLSSLSRSIAGGTSEVQRSLVAHRTLGLPRGAR